MFPPPFTTARTAILCLFYVIPLFFWGTFIFNIKDGGGGGGGVYRVLVGRTEGKRPLGRPRRRWEDNIKMDLREIEIGGANWIRLAQDTVQWRAFVNTVMNLRVP
jgi:hypothetical protein